MTNVTPQTPTAAPAPPPANPAGDRVDQAARTLDPNTLAGIQRVANDPTGYLTDRDPNCFVFPPALIREGTLRVEAALRRYLDCRAWQDFSPYAALGDYSPEPQMLGAAT